MRDSGGTLRQERNRKARNQESLWCSNVRKAVTYEMGLEREAAGHSELGGLLRIVDTTPGAMENRSREEQDQISVFKSSRCLLLL